MISFHNFFLVFGRVKRHRTSTKVGESASPGFFRCCLYSVLFLAPFPLLAVSETTIAVVSIEADPRHEPRRIEKQFPGHPTGRAIDGVLLAVRDSDFELESSGIEVKVKDVVISPTSNLRKVVNELNAEKIKHIIADLPAHELSSLVQTISALPGAFIIINASSDDDGLRGNHCGAYLLHTYPSRAMLSDALAQYLAARNWRRAMVLQGPLEEDAKLWQAFQRAAKRYGVKITSHKPFKPTRDPRERDVGNVRLLTGSDREHEVVVVLDSDGEFARNVPYTTQLPRPVVGSAGLVPVAWHPLWERNGGPQLSRRFARTYKRAMTGHDWAAWTAGRAIVSVLTSFPKSSTSQQLKALREGVVVLDGFKGVRLSFRAWDGQLRQPVFLAHDGVIDVAPFHGVLHPKEALDTLGVDEAESTCKNRP